MICRYKGNNPKNLDVGRIKFLVAFTKMLICIKGNIRKEDRYYYLFYISSVCELIHQSVLLTIKIITNYSKNARWI